MSQSPSLTWLLIDGAQQRLLLMTGAKIQRIFPAATALAGFGEKQDSEKTPRGWHVVAEKHGDACPPDGVLLGRQWTKEIYSQALAKSNPGKDWILTRILWLHGMEPGKNQGQGCDSYARYIYIHGAPEAKVNRGKSSKGCINLTTPAILAIYPLIEVGTPLYVGKSLDQQTYQILYEQACQVQATFQQPVEQHVD